MSAVDEAAVRRRLDAYLEAFAACGRGDADPAALLAFYRVPLLFTADAGALALTTEAEVLAALTQQVAGARATGYDHSDILEAEVCVLNATTAVYRGAFRRVGVDGAEVGRLAATYLFTQDDAGLRIAAAVLHGP